MLDTGASVVTLTEVLAKKLNIDILSVSPVQAILADGTKVTARPVLLQSVEVGDARVDNVHAVVLPNHPGEGIDGLLGMSFLKNFYIQIDSSRKNLILSRFKPK